MLKYSLATIALLASTSFALAQDMDRGDKGSGASNSATEHAPGQMKDSGSAKDLAPGQTKEGTSAKDYAPGQQKEDSATRSDEKGGSTRKSEESEHSRDMKSDRNEKTDASDQKAKSDRDAAKDERADDKSRDEKLRHEHEGSETRKGGASTGASEGTEGRIETHKGGASTGVSEGTEGRSGGRVSITKVSEDKKVRVKSVFARHRVERVRDLGVAVNVGVRLPRNKVRRVYPVPEEIVRIVPEYRGYDYIMLEDGRVLIIDPDTYEIVDIIEIA
jgi:hypothetical protein